MKKIAVLILSLCLALSLAACGGDTNTPSPSGAQSAPPENSQTEPPASSEPEPSEPECEHDWTEANYQAPKTCVICGETEGTTLTAVFEGKGYQYMTLGTTYDYTTLCNDNPSVSSTGQVTVTDYKVIESDETHEAKEGYEWRIVKIYSEFTDDNAWEYGRMYRQNEVDYYSGERFDYYTNTEAYAESDNDFFTMTYQGETYECFNTVDILEQGWDGRVLKFSYETSYLLPTGYDGFVIVLRSSEHETDHEVGSNTVDFPAVLNDPNTLFFRLA